MKEQPKRIRPTPQPVVTPQKEKRREVRIRESSDHQVKAELTVEDTHTWKGLRILDLSHHGVLVEVPPLRIHLIQEKQRVLVKLRLENEGVSFLGTIQHRQDNHVGIQFAETVAKEWRYDEPILGRMICSLERKQLRRRAYESTL